MKALREAHKFPDTHIINMDETPMYFDMPGNTTVNKKGHREVRIRSTGAEKRRVTVILYRVYTATRKRARIVLR